MTTETQAEDTQPTDNKVIFGPLGKYAVIAVIMVSIIVTTAIMLDKQLSTTEKQIAEVEADIAASREEKKNTAENTVSTEASTEAGTIETADADLTTSSTDVTTASAQTPSADVLVMTETAPVETTAEILPAETTGSLTAAATGGISTEMAVSSTTEEAAQPSVAGSLSDETDIEKARLARIDAFKLEQKKHISEMFARIKALETKQLDQYKTSQAGQVSRLREQIARQEQMIEALVSRNKDLFEMRAANVQRIQNDREAMLNRI
ncbi:MAG TPA: hypothetical protein ENJ87_08665 [Gammaproteobacteria bacterium]|nr:hypothetical protein [Gammaproteobacteria bacterium]